MGGVELEMVRHSGWEQRMGERFGFEERIFGELREWVGWMLEGVAGDGGEGFDGSGAESFFGFLRHARELVTVMHRIGDS